MGGSALDSTVEFHNVSPEEDQHHRIYSGERDSIERLSPKPDAAFYENWSRLLGRGPPPVSSCRISASAVVSVSEVGSDQSQAQDAGGLSTRTAHRYEGAPCIYAHPLATEPGMAQPFAAERPPAFLAAADGVPSSTVLAPAFGFSRKMFYVSRLPARYLRPIYHRFAGRWSHRHVRDVP